MAEKANAKETLLSVDSGLKTSAELAFSDTDASDTGIDWGAASGGPEIELDAWSKARLRLAGIPWLAIETFVEASGKIKSATLGSATGDPYLAAESAAFAGLVGSGIELSHNFNGYRIEVDASPVVGLSLLDLSEADSRYLPVGAVAGDFWFRVEPRAGADIALTLKSGDLRVEAKGRYLFLWDSGAAYGRDWALGFEEKAELELSYPIAKSKDYSLKATASGDFSLESRLVAPVMKFQAAPRLDLSIDRLGSLRLTPFGFAHRSELPGLDISKADDVKRSLSAKIEWESDLPDGEWSLFLRAPLWADEDATAVAGEWALGLGWKVEK